MNVDNIKFYLQDIFDAFSAPKFWLCFSFLQSFIATYIFSEWNFAIGFFIIFLVDTWSGIYVSWKKKVFSVKTLKDKLTDKSVAYFSIIISYSVATKITLNNSAFNILDFLDVGFYSICITAEFFSIIRTWYKYKKWPILKKLMAHYKDFDDEID